MHCVICITIPTRCSLLSFNRPASCGPIRVWGRQGACSGASRIGLARIDCFIGRLYPPFVQATLPMLGVFIKMVAMEKGQAPHHHPALTARAVGVRGRQCPNRPRRMLVLEDQPGTPCQCIHVRCAYYRPAHGSPRACGCCRPPPAQLPKERDTLSL